MFSRIWAQITLTQVIVESNTCNEISIIVKDDNSVYDTIDEIVIVEPSPHNYVNQEGYP